MNGKQAKLLRRYARLDSVGMIDRQLLGKKTVRGGRVRVQAINSDRSIRGVYRAMKRRYKPPKDSDEIEVLL